MKKTIKPLFTAILLCNLFYANAQVSSRIDQFYLDNTVVNPAAISLQKGRSLSLIYNRAYAGVAGGPQNIVANLVMPSKDQRAGFGVFYLRENAGFQQLHNAYLTYSYAFPVSDNTKLSFGASLGVLSQNFDASKATPYQQDDNTIRAIMYSPAVTRADFRASGYLQAGNFTGGVAFSRLAKPSFDYSYYNYKASATLQSLSNLLLSYNIVASEEISIKPALLFNFYDFNYANFRGNVSMYYKEKFWFGVCSDAASQLGFNAGFKTQNAISCGYSVNLLAGKMKGVLGPIHEFFIKFPFGGGSSASATAVDADKTSKPDVTDEEEDNKKEPAKPASRRLVETQVTDINTLKNAGKDLDTAGIHFPALDKKPTPGIYLVVGMNASEAKMDKLIKELYMKEIYAYKLYDPINHSYYVWIKQFATQSEASKFIQNTDNPNLPDAWIRTVK